MKRILCAIWVFCAFAVQSEPAVRWLVVHTNGTVCPSGYVASASDLAQLTAQTGSWNTAYSFVVSNTATEMMVSWTRSIFDRYDSVGDALTSIDSSLYSASQGLNSHITNYQNPHGMTAEQAGAVATNNAAFLAAVVHTNRIDNPHAVTAAQAGAVSVAQNAALKEITGFADPSAVTVSYDQSARTVTLSQTGGVSLWWRGTNIVWGSPWTSQAHTNVTDKYYLAMRTGTNVEWSTSAWTFDMLQIAYVNYGGSATIGFREPHGLMQWQAHESAHRNIGCYRLSGLAPVAGTYAVQSAVTSNNAPTFAAGQIQDEDNQTSIAQVNEGSYTLLNFTNRVAYFQTNVANLVYIGSTYPLINTAASNNVETTTLRYFNVWQLLMPVTADAQSQAYRMVFVQPQLAHSSLSAAQAEDFRSLNLGDFSAFGPEFVAFCKLTFVTSASYTSAGKMRIESVSYLSGSQASQTVITSLTSPSTADAISVAATPSNYGAAAANVENHLSGIDAKFGAAITNQTWGAVGTNATYRVSWDITNGTWMVQEILP